MLSCPTCWIGSRDPASERLALTPLALGRGRRRRPTSGELNASREARAKRSAVGCYLRRGRARPTREGNRPSTVTPSPIPPPLVVERFPSSDSFGPCPALSGGGGLLKPRGLPSRLAAVRLSSPYPPVKGGGGPEKDGGPTTGGGTNNVPFVKNDPQTGVALGSSPGPQCAFEMSMLMCPAVHTTTRSLLRLSSTHEPSDPPLRVILINE